jgi:predicted enzyme related to lactoylglutathione lyase
VSSERGDAVITGVQFVSVDVTDQDRAKDFYTNVLGFEVLSDDPMGEVDGPRWIALRPKGADTHVVLYQADAAKAGLNHLVFASDDIEATYAELSARGVEFTVKPKIESWGSWWAQFRDSEGNEFGLGQRTEDRP